MQDSLLWMTLSICPACRSDLRRKVYGLRETMLYQCGACGLRYIDPCLDPEAMKQVYESNQSLSAMHAFHEGYYDYGDLKKPSRTLLDFQRGISLLERGLSRKGKILDVGYGNGFFLAAARERGWEVRGIDSSASNRDAAKKKFGLELTVSGFERYAPEETFDAISFWDVIEHLPDPSEALQKAFRLLAPGGLVLIAVPNDHSLLALLAGFLYRVGLKNPVRKIYFPEHVSYYSLATLRPLAEKNGFTLKGHFTTSTDLAKYSLPRGESLAAGIVLFGGRLFGLQNRLVAVFQKNPV